MGSYHLAMRTMCAFYNRQTDDYISEWDLCLLAGTAITSSTWMPRSPEAPGPKSLMSLDNNTGSRREKQTATKVQILFQVQWGSDESSQSDKRDDILSSMPPTRLWVTEVPQSISSFSHLFAIKMDWLQARGLPPCLGGLKLWTISIPSIQ